MNRSLDLYELNFRFFYILSFTRKDYIFEGVHGKCFNKFDKWFINLVLLMRLSLSMATKSASFKPGQLSLTQQEQSSKQSWTDFQIISSAFTSVLQITPSYKRTWAQNSQCHETVACFLWYTLISPVLKQWRCCRVLIIKNKHIRLPFHSDKTWKNSSRPASMLSHAVFMCHTVSCCPNTPCVKTAFTVGN